MKILCFYVSKETGYPNVQCQCSFASDFLCFQTTKAFCPVGTKLLIAHGETVGIIVK